MPLTTLPVRGRFTTLIRRPSRIGGVALIALCFSGTATGPLAATAAPTYEDDIKPMLRGKCLGCHNIDEANAGLDLSTFAGIMKGGSSGPAVVAGRPDSSTLYRAVTHMDGVEPMPPDSGRLPDDVIRLFNDWIRGGLLERTGAALQLAGVTAIDPTKLGTTGNLPAIMPGPLAIRKPVATVRPPLPQALAASPTAPLLAVTGHEQVLLYEVAEADGGLRLLGCLPFREGTIHSLRFSRTGGLLVAGGGRGAHSGRAVVYDIAKGTRVAEAGDLVDVVLCVDIDSSQRFVALGGPTKVVEVIELTTGAPRHRITRHTDWITAVAFSPDGGMLATGDRSGGIHVWETESGAIVFSLAEHRQRITALEWRTDGQVVASTAEDGNLILWNMKDGWPAVNIVAHAAKASSRYARATGVLACGFRPDGGLVTVGRDGFLRAWSTAGTIEHETRVNDRLPISVAWLGDDTTAVGGMSGGIELWSMAGKPTSISSQP